MLKISIIVKKKKKKTSTLIFWSFSLILISLIVSNFNCYELEFDSVEWKMIQNSFLGSWNLCVWKCRHCHVIQGPDGAVVVSGGAKVRGVENSARAHEFRGPAGVDFAEWGVSGGRCRVRRYGHACSGLGLEDWWESADLERSPVAGD